MIMLDFWPFAENENFCGNILMQSILNKKKGTESEKPHSAYYNLDLCQLKAFLFFYFHFIYLNKGPLLSIDWLVLIENIPLNRTLFLKTAK